ncbi:MAG: adenosylcobinamide-phosphate synthase CbiB [Sulfurovum sp.]|jgi:adenosylcobinamide-phosphate synthase|nr:MAG: Cobalamin biosynthesis protein CobD [Arcobacter lacus]
MYFDLALFSYIIDRVFGEFTFIKAFKHPIIFIGDYIKWFEKRFYSNSIYRGIVLTTSLLFMTFMLCSFIDYFVDNVYVLAFLCSFSISSKMLYDAVKEIIKEPSKIKYLVSRDTQNLSKSDINKAAVETYAENLSDGVIAPLFYLICFGIYGAFLYKAVNTLDSMVGYRNEKYEKYGKFSARLDDVLNYIPSRITALLIAILFFSLSALKNFNRYGKLHKSPNAGLPISAMGFCINARLGGDTVYFGKLTKKPFLSVGSRDIHENHILKALAFRNRFDILFIVSFGFIVLTEYIF